MKLLDASVPSNPSCAHFVAPGCLCSQSQRLLLQPKCEGTATHREPKPIESVLFLFYKYGQLAQTKGDDRNQRFRRLITFGRTRFRDRPGVIPCEFALL